MYVISKALKGQEFLYSTKYIIDCGTKARADKIATFLNEHNDTSVEPFKLKDNEIWHTYELDKYDSEPRYKLHITKGRIRLEELI